MRLRVLLMADSHLGFDLPTRPRVKRRRRGHDFLANHSQALRSALDREVDVVVHGGDVFHRSRVAASLVHQAFEPIKRVADAGIPVFVVPGNHERSKIPHAHLASHPGIHVFDSALTHQVRVRGTQVAISGFPYQRRDVRTKFRSLLTESGCNHAEADIRLLCVHHCVEGATVGPGDYTFRDGADVIRGRDLPRGVAAVLSGHIHRHQVLTSDLRGNALPAPVVYPGSVERTSIAEIDEAKGYVILEVEPSAQGGKLKTAAPQGEPKAVRNGGDVAPVQFVELPARPMVVRELRLDGSTLTAAELDRWLRSTVDALAPDAVLRLKVRGPVPVHLDEFVSAPRIRGLAPATMNVDLTVADKNGSRVRAPMRTGRNAPTTTVDTPQTELAL